MELGLDDLTHAALKRLVQRLLAATEQEEQVMLKKLGEEAGKNKLADLDEEMHGKPKTPKVGKDDLPGDGELPPVPKAKRS